MESIISVGKRCKAVLFLTLLIFCSCDPSSQSAPEDRSPVSLSNIARMISELPLDSGHLREVHNAVTLSAENGYDEEYTMSQIFSAPGSGVGSEEGASRAGEWDNPLKSLISSWFQDKYGVSTRSSDGYTAQDCLSMLSASDVQIYWPYSEDWDGESLPVVTFDPGYSAETNIGYELCADGTVKEITVSEELASQRPVWVINNNRDSGYQTLQTYQRLNAGKAKLPTRSGSKTLYVKDLTMLRHYDCWFAGASEFFIKCGSIENFTASTEAELKLYSPQITDFMVVVKRKQLGKAVPVNTVLMSGMTDQIERLAFMVTEDDGGSKTSWKCSAVVKIKSKSYGFDIELPFNSRDDIVWRGSLASDFFEGKEEVSGTFSGVKIGFEIK
jgi:hypothetical protein